MTMKDSRWIDLLIGAVLMIIACSGLAFVLWISGNWHPL